MVKKINHREFGWFKNMKHGAKIIVDDNSYMFLSDDDIRFWLCKKR